MCDHPSPVAEEDWALADMPITIAAGDYDRTRAIRDGRVTVDGCDVTYLTLRPEELFFRAVRYAEFDVCELSFSSYLMQTQRGVSAYIAIPVFLSRLFRHSGFYIRTDCGIDGPADLKGKTVGVPEYQVTASLWQRGLLKDECGIEASEIKWRAGGLEQPGREERTPLHLPDAYDYQRIPDDKTLSGMLEAGEIDAVIAPPMPSCFWRGAPNVARLWPDYRTVKQDYYRRTGMHPIMHLVGVRKSLVEKYPWLPANLYKAFRQAKDIAIANLEYITALNVMLPWVGAEHEATRAVLGEDFWPYGLEVNSKEVETLIRYSHEQGLTEPGLDPQDLFAETTLAVAKV